MTLLALIAGQIFRQPENKTSKNGKAFLAGTLRIKDGESSQFVRFVAFSETAQAELMRLVDGDAVSVQGPLKVETYEKDGATEISLSIIADRVLALRQPPKERKAQKERDAPCRGGAAAFDDSIPFARAP
ncbi:MAG TPA: single-stranded DNA-binding protein [Methylocella sp.]|jgi:single-stranded DNA-binding protein|nr:single-stranded DNA-binding protein [Methylocella sp.]